eukprot:Sspe_Gene.58605::Locus_32152_Transcript_1_1_Confidence_1.000_Length_2755::g.58605::m.58605
MAVVLPPHPPQRALRYFQESTMSRVTLLDGSMGTALRMRLPQLRDDPIWAARALMSNPDEVVRLHTDYLEAGADVLTCNNYSCVPVYLKHSPELDMVNLTMLAVQHAVRARDEKGSSAKIALSLPPLRQSYSTEVEDPNLAFDVYSRIVNAAAPSVDLFLAETVAVARAAIPALSAAASPGGCGRPSWVSYTLMDDNSGVLRSGESVSRAYELLEERKIAPGALLFNCSPPDSVTAGMKALSKVSLPPDVAVGGYANAFYPIPAGWDHHAHGAPRDRDVPPEDYLAAAKQWVELGGTRTVVVGGCCGILPHHLQRLSAGLRKPKRALL